MTIDIAGLRKLLAEARATPWGLDAEADDDNMWGVSGPPGSSDAGYTRERPFVADAARQRDAALIVAAVNALGPLLDRLERMEAAWASAQLKAYPMDGSKTFSAKEIAGLEEQLARDKVRTAKLEAVAEAAKAIRLDYDGDSGRPYIHGRDALGRSLAALDEPGDGAA